MWGTEPRYNEPRFNEILVITNSKGILGGGVPPGSSDPSQTTECYFLLPFSDQSSKIHTRFQTWPLGRNYVIIT